ncbi:hypothetical protein [Streptomyces sp. JJ38]|uniref:hypothetical protein n=1 Tax=Streptomyces sp. JJ38 TaxID=2738128 RepID=UPI001C5A01B3|nr:hypothetical protein [Streptomyces sp. JJ38]MBW1596944.1 hypothetical protein [Streptomyces sp. JJ38]
MPRRQLGAYLAAGLLLTMFGRLIVTWIAFGFGFVDTSVGEFLQAVLFDRSIVVEQELLAEHQWALTVALLVVGLLALLGRRVARGGALLLAFLMAAIALRELVGLATDERFRDWYVGSNGLAGQIIGTWVMALLIAVGVLVLMLRAGDRPAPGAPAAARGPGAARYTVVGVLLIVLCLAEVGWIIRTLADGVDAGDYFLGLVDASVDTYGNQIAGSWAFFGFAYAVALLVTGLLALLRRPVVRGAALTLAGTLLYFQLRFVVNTTFAESLFDDAQWPHPTWSMQTDHLEGWLRILTMVGGAVLAAVVIALVLGAPERDRAGTEAVVPPGAMPRWPAPPAQPAPGTGPTPPSALLTAPPNLPPPPAAPPR